MQQDLQMSALKFIVEKRLLTLILANERIVMVKKVLIIDIDRETASHLYR